MNDTVRRCILVSGTLAALFAMGKLAFGQPTTRPTPPATLAPDFIVGVFMQPASSAVKWRARGINTAFFWEPEKRADGTPTMPRAAWRKAWREAGGAYVDGPSGDAAADMTDANLVAVGHDDEADRRGVPAPDLLRLNDQWHATIGKPTYANFDGHQFDNVYYDGTPHPSRPPTDPQHWGHRAATGGYFAAADWVGFDYYLWPQRPEMWSIHERLLSRAWEWGGHRPVLLYVELGQAKGVTSIDPVEQIVLHALAYCARQGIAVRGIVYFPQRVDARPFAYDDLAPGVAAELGNLNAKLTGGRLAPPQPAPRPAADLGPLQRSIDGVRLQVLDGQRQTEQQLDAILEAARATTRPTTRPSGPE